MNDAASGGNGNDLLIGDGIATSSLFGGAFNDTILGGAGDDVLNGGPDQDRLVGGDGNDTIDGGSGNDLLIGGAGVNLLTGGAGNDIFGIRSGAGVNHITDFTPANDRIRIDLALADSFAKLDAVTSNYNEGGLGVIEFTNGQKILLAGIDATTLNANWFQYTFV